MNKDNGNLSIEEQATNFHTVKHIRMVGRLIGIILRELMDRLERHDQSKLEHPEVSLFTEWTPKLANVSYGSPEYNKFLEELKPALDHHYARNDHHPEHFKNGVNDMNLIQLVEMLCDWKAASLRHHDGNIRKSIEINSKRFGLSQQLVTILENTASLFDSIGDE